MSLEGVPKVFWYSMSFCLVLMTGIVGALAFKANDVSVKYKDIEFKTTKLLEIESIDSLRAFNLVTQESLFLEKEKELNDLKKLNEEREKEILKIRSELIGFKENMNNNETEITRTLIKDIDVILDSTKTVKVMEKENNIKDIEFKQQQQQQQYWNQQQQQQQQILKSRKK